MDRFDLLTSFVAVAEAGGFAKAARERNISAPAVTRAIAALEKHLGVPLFNRSTRSVALTEDGALLLDRAREILQQLQETEHIVMGGRSEPRGEINVTAPVVFGRLHVLPVLAELLTQHRDLTARLLLVDRNIRLIEEGIDVAVRIGDLPDSSLKAIALGSVRQAIVASPAYCARRGRPQEPKDLLRHDIVLGDNVRGGNQWRFGKRGGHAVPVTPPITVNGVDATLAAVKAGLGIANVLSYQAAEGLASGALCILLEDHAPPPVPVQLLFHPNRARMPAVGSVIDAMRARAKSGAWN